jgi:hypothetical protein
MKIYGSKVIGRINDVLNIVKENDVGLLILADYQMATRKYKEFRKIASFKPARIVVAPDIFGSLSGLVKESPSNDVTVNLNDFQCQHCLARYATQTNIKVDEPVIQE